MSGWIQVFYRGADDALWTRWRNGDGSWADEVSMGGTLTNDPFAVPVPGTSILQVFYRGADYALWTRWRDADGNWSGEMSLGGKLNGNANAIAVPGTNILQEFYRGADNGVWSRWRDHNGNWIDEVSMGGVLNGDPVAAAVPGTDVLELFYRGADNALVTRWRDPVTGWQPEVYMGGSLNGDPVAAAVPGTDVLELFYRGADNALVTRWRDPVTGWQPEVYMGGTLNGDPRAVEIPGTGILQLFYRGADNALVTRWRDPVTGWQPEVDMGGVLNSDPFAAAAPPGWMARQPDDRKLSQLSIPGTHESCTAFITPAASAQSWSLQAQLEHGIRYVDIRCRHIQDIFAINHDVISVGFNFDAVRDVCVNFLQAHPTECLVMQVKHEYTDGPDNNLTFQEVFDNYVAGFNSFFYLDDHVPTLGEVRGKIVIVRRFELDGNGPRGLTPLTWQDNANSDIQYEAGNHETVTFHIQDQYAVDPANLDAKWNEVQDLLYRASTDQSDAWYINFASGASAGAWPNAVAAQINPPLYDFVDGTYPARLGTLMLDFPDDNLITRVVNLNV
jgi:1-phosphatidylinositol phosphodiesterase